ncbi:MAG TPA: CBS domain-containing protein [Gaiellaceae bacterium]|nr:CBS domain-containing protein [Gaiellaceae bacterium]
MPPLTEIDLAPAFVPRTATFLEAAEALVSSPVSTIAVLDDDEHVVGLFGDEALLSGLFPRYLAELHHTAFTADDSDMIDTRTREVASEPVKKHMAKPVVLDSSTSAIHCAQRFLHCDFGALPVVEEGRFVGMLGRGEFCRAVLRKSLRDADP